MKAKSQNPPYIIEVKHSETVLYGERDIWVRPSSMWNENVKYDGRLIRRFIFLNGS